MSKDFDTTLSDALDLAGAAAQTAGASAARIRGRKRTVRKRIAVSTASAVLVAAVGTTAAVMANSQHGGSGVQLTATKPPVTATPGPSGSLSPASSASASPNATASASPSYIPAIIIGPHTVYSAVWLDPAQMPFADTFHWQTMVANPKGLSPIGQQLTPTVFYVANDTPFQTLTMCANPKTLLGRTIGAQQEDFTTGSISDGNWADQFIFYFADPTSAQQTFAWLQGLYSSCQGESGGVTVTKTGGDGQTSSAWLKLDSAKYGTWYTREYFVQRGSTIAFVSISSNSHSLPTTYDDAAELSAIAAHLCWYGGDCH